MARPETIRRGPRKKASFWARLRRRYDRVWTAHRLAQRKSRHRRSIGVSQQKTPAFIFGCQRSGTNMTLRVLNRLLDVDTFEEVDPRAFKHARILGRDIQDKLIAESTAKCVVFKPICDSHRALELLSGRPNAKAIWVYRRYQDVANSAVYYWGDQTRTWIEDLLEGGGDWGVSQWNRENVTDECLAEIREACSEGLSVHGACGLFWYMRNRTFFEQKLEANPHTILADYEAMVTDPQKEFARLSGFLDVAFHPSIVEKVFSSSIRKHEPPPMSERIHDLCRGMQERLDRACRA
ncbi:MAG: sulfotransferase domain-containing protein [Planctomycetota bacterium]